MEALKRCIQGGSWRRRGQGGLGAAKGAAQPCGGLASACHASTQTWGGDSAVTGQARACLCRAHPAAGDTDTPTRSKDTCSQMQSHVESRNTNYCAVQGSAQGFPGPRTGPWGAVRMGRGRGAFQASRVAGRLVEGSPGRRPGWPEPEGRGEAMGAGWRGLRGRSTPDPAQLLTLSRRICKQRCDKIQFAI